MNSPHISTLLAAFVVSAVGCLPHATSETRPAPPSGSKIIIGGPLAPDGATEVACDLPVEARHKNRGGRDGSGLCVFCSVDHAALYQDDANVAGLFQKMFAENGGGWPAKVDAMMRKYCPSAQYLQYEGSDSSVLKLALKTGRMPSVTYNGHCPHYGMNQSIAHMVNLIHLDDKYAVVLDNNFIGERDLVWLSPADFYKRWRGNGSGWTVILLSPPPPPIPHN
ncbi:hypothetical protein AYO40_00625 [Planctomycetaceae bacterium SCGC AG-212-D15]|nr:hypothetical protein AYO40_00625 [Planctomycetaceae bacterium SCGC AG-212-D15]